MTRLFVFCAVVLIALAGCKSAPTAPESGAAHASPAAPASGGSNSATAKPPPAAAAPEPIFIPGPNGRPQPPAPFIAPSGSVSPPPAVSVSPLPAGAQSSQRVAHITELLEAGREDLAGAEIQQLLAIEPNNRMAQNFQHQITADPAASLGTESFSYTIKPGDSMSGLARKFLGDGNLFYLLARYNDIKVPRQLTVGQTIKVPGRLPPGLDASTESPAAGATTPVGVTAAGVSPPPSAPIAPSTPSPSPVVATAPGSTGVPAAPTIAETQFERWYRIGQQAQSAGDNEKALTAYRQAAQLDPSNADAKAKVEQVRQDLVTKYTFTARSAFAKQDLDGAINNWDRVIGLDPANETAKLERQKTINLREKLKSIQ